jgi:type I restriction enzyme S subunit
MIPEGWRQELADMVFTKITKGTTPPKSDLVIKGGVPFLRVNNLGGDGGRKIQGGIIFVSEQCHENVLSRSRCFPGDILINIVGPPLGKSIFLNSDFPFYNINQAIVLFRADENLINRNYAYYFINGDFAKNWLASHAKKTSGQQNLTIETCKSLPVYLPPAVEQQRIAEILVTWDRAIETVDALIANARAQKMALMQSLLTGKHRLPGFSGDWAVKQLGDAFAERSERGDDTLTLLSVTQSGGVVRQAEAGRKNISSADQSNYKTVLKGDIAYNTMRMWQGASALSNLIGKVSPAYTIVTPRHGHDARFYAYLFKWLPMIHVFERHSQGLVSDTWNLKYPHFSKIKVSVPPLDEQVAIRRVLDAGDEEEAALRGQLAALRREKSALMQQLLTGKRRVKITEREHA